MTSDDLDRALSGDGELVPSSGFVASVMAAVLAERSAPPPIPFPWRRALAGLAAVLAMILAVPIAWLLRPASFTAAARSTSTFGSVADLVNWMSAHTEVQWAVLALAATYVLVDVPRRMIASR